MCQVKPGRRCAYHTRHEIRILRNRIEENNSEVEARWKANHPGEDYSPQKGLAHAPAMEYVLRNLEDSLEKAEVAYLSTPSGAAEAREMVEALRQSGNVTAPELFKRINALQSQLQRAATQNGLRDSAIQQINDYKKMVDGFPAGDKVRTLESEIAQDRLQLSSSNLLDKLQSRQEEAENNLSLAERDLTRALEAVDADITNGRNPDKSLETWRNKFTEMKEAQNVAAVATERFGEDLVDQRERRREEKAAHAALNARMRNTSVLTDQTNVTYSDGSDTTPVEFSIGKKNFALQLNPQKLRAFQQDMEDTMRRSRDVSTTTVGNKVIFSDDHPDNPADGTPPLQFSLGGKDYTVDFTQRKMEGFQRDMEDTMRRFKDVSTTTARKLEPAPQYSVVTPPGSARPRQS